MIVRIEVIAKIMRIERAKSEASVGRKYIIVTGKFFVTLKQK